MPEKLDVCTLYDGSLCKFASLDCPANIMRRPEVVAAGLSTASENMRDIHLAGPIRSSVVEHISKVPDSNKEGAAAVLESIVKERIHKQLALRAAGELANMMPGLIDNCAQEFAPYGDPIEVGPEQYEAAARVAAQYFLS
jgi:hypothetical protein